MVHRLTMKYLTLMTLQTLEALAILTYSIILITIIVANPFIHETISVPGNKVKCQSRIGHSSTIIMRSITVENQFIYHDIIISNMQYRIFLAEMSKQLGHTTNHLTFNLCRCPNNLNERIIHPLLISIEIISECQYHK